MASGNCSSLTENLVRFLMCIPYGHVTPLPAKSLPLSGSPQEKVFLTHVKSKQVFLKGGGTPPGGDLGTRVLPWASGIPSDGGSPPSGPFSTAPHGVTQP